MLTSEKQQISPTLIEATDPLLLIPLQLSQSLAQHLHKRGIITQLYKHVDSVDGPRQINVGYQRASVMRELLHQEAHVQAGGGPIHSVQIH